MISLINIAAVALAVFCAHIVEASNCCLHQGNSSLLLSCVHDALAMTVVDTPISGPTFDLGIIFYSTAEISDYASYSLAVMLEYAKHHGYHLLAYNETTGSFDANDHRWNKVRLLSDALDPTHGVARYWDYVVWVDADLIVLDFELNLDRIVSDTTSNHGLYNKGHIWLSAEHGGSSTRVNSGMVVVRNSVWARNFLLAWWTFADRRLYSDQEQFDLLFSALESLANAGGDGSDALSLQARHQDPQVEELLLRLVPAARLRSSPVALPQVVVLPPHALNSDPPAMVKQQPHHQVLHLMGENAAFRIKAFSTALANICAAYRGTGKMEVEVGGDGHSNAGAAAEDDRRVVPSLLPPQLGLSQPQLLKWTLECYYVESVALMRAFGERLARGEPSSTSQARLMSNSVHHFAHAMEHVNELHWNRTLVLGRRRNIPGTALSSEKKRTAEVATAGMNGEEDAYPVDVAPVLELFETSVVLRDSSGPNGDGDSSLELSTLQLLYDHLIVSFRMRVSLYTLLKRNSVLRRRRMEDEAARQGDEGRCAGMKSADLELLKATAEAGQNLVHIKYYGPLSVRAKLQVADEVYKLLAVDIKRCCHKQQFQAIDIMVSQLHVDVGIMLSHNNYVDSDAHALLRDRMGARFEDDADDDGNGGLTMNATTCYKLALRHFRESVRILDSVTEYSTNQRSIWQNMGSHVVVQPLMWVIKTLEKLGYSVEAAAEQRRLAAVISH
jgi:hypothetical protein